MKTVALRNSEDPMNWTNDDRVELISAGWAAVDNLHAMRQLLTCLLPDEILDPQTAFINAIESATVMRNRMDHIHQQLRNLAGQSGIRYPLLGTAIFLIVREQDNPRVMGEHEIIGSGCLVMVSAGGVPDGEAALEVSNPAGRALRPPISHLQFNAFDQVLQISEVFDLAGAAMLDLADRTDELFRKEAERIAAENGISVEEVLRPQAQAGLVTNMEIQFGRGPTRDL